jgi:putative ABC transport system permease protein
MRARTRLACLLKNIFGNALADRELDEEVRSYVDLLTQEKIQAGVPPPEARRQSLIEAGGVEQVKEEIRAARAGAGLEILSQDLRFAFRVLLKKPSFTIFAALTLAIGIGANTAIFSIVHSLLLEPLPFTHADRLVIPWTIYREGGQTRVPASGPELTELRARSRTLEEIAGIWSTNVAFTGDGEPEQVKAGMVTANFFSCLGAQAALGRTFLPSEEGSGVPTAIVLSDGLWRRRFGADPHVVGRTVRVDGGSATVVGVMGPAFQTIFPPDASVPPTLQAWFPFPDKLAAQPRDMGYLRLVSRLRPGFTVEQAQSEASAIAGQLRAEFGEFKTQGLDLQIIPLHNDVVREIRPAILMLWSAVTLVLLIACANVANLLLLRMSERRREIMVRVALGAGRNRIFRQLLTESLLLSTVGGAAGVAVAWALLHWYPSIRPTEVTQIYPSGLNLQVLAFACGIALLCGVVFGLAPAFSSFSMGSGEGLKDGGRGSTDRASSKLRGALVMCEVTLGLVLLVGAGLMIRTLMRLLEVDPGFDSSHTLTFLVSLPGSRYNDSTSALFIRQLRQNLAAVPGVRGVGASSHIPFGDAPNWYSNYWPEGASAEQQDSLMSDYRSITPGYFQSLGVALIVGRDFNDSDDSAHRRVVIVDELLAAQTWPGREPVGQKLNVEVIENGEFKRAWADVVGVVRHIKYHSLMRQVRPQAYEPFSQTVRWQMVFAVRSDTSERALLPAIRAEVRKLDKDMPIAAVFTMDQYLAVASSKTRFTTILIGGLAGIALVLACIGIYGVTSFTVARRSTEIGIRMALGAQPLDILRLILWQAMRPVAVGITLGLSLSLVLAPALATLLFGVRPLDALTLTSVCFGLLTVGAIACYVPARRAVSIDPILTLRCE